MSDYNKQYSVEENLFGAPYKEFVLFVQQHAVAGGKALDLGCGQGRDALMLAENGYAVTGVDNSQVGISQMVARAKNRNLDVTGVVADLHIYEPDSAFDIVVLDSMLHFGKKERDKELALLNKATASVKDDGYLFVFVHKSPKKEKELKDWYTAVATEFHVVEEGVIDYIYAEKATGFTSAFQYFMFILQRVSNHGT